MLRVWLTGGLRLENDDAKLAPPRSRRARALLAWLALRPGMHARGELAGRFWPDVLDESARTSLRAALTELRDALGDGAAHLAATREAVGLDGGDELWVDVRAFGRLLAEGRADEAVAACSGELLSGMDEDWVHEARADHTERMGAALETLAARAERDGDHAEAVRRTRAAVALDPLAEEPNRRLIRRLAAAGDRASAITAYEQLAARLRTNLGLAPSAATRALAEAVRRGETTGGAPGVAAADATGPVAPPDIPTPAAVAHAGAAQFVGRAAELDRLRAAWAGVRMHRARRLVLLAGEPGIGKTLTALRFAHAASDDGALVLLGRCSEEPLSAYEPLAEVLRHVVTGVGPGALGALAGQAASELDRLLGSAPVDGAADDPGARHRLFDAVDAVLAALAGDRPLLLVLDDLHWADRPTLALLGFLLRSPRRTSLLALGSYRTTELGRRTPLTGALADLQRDGALDRILLGGLEPDEVAELADARLGEGAGERVARSIHTRTRGNAFFVDEVLRGLAEHAGDPVPESVRHAVSVRLSRLGEAADELLAVAAILGIEVDLGVLEAVAELPARTAEAALDELLAEHLLQPSPGAARGVEFPHALVRETVYAELNALRRARLHRRTADVLISISEERHLEAIAHHLFEAASTTDAARAVDYLTRAGARAMAMLAYEEAAGFYGRALEVLGADDPARTADLLLARGDALLRAGEPASAQPCYAQAAGIARTASDATLLARAALGHAGLGVTIIDVDPARVALLEEALAAVGDRDPALSSELLARLAVELYYAPSRDRSEALSAEAVAAARAADDARALASALNARHVALWRPDRLDERRAAAAEMIDAARAAGDRGLELQGHNWLVVDLWELGDLAAWRAEVRRHGALAEDLRLPGYAWYSPLWAAVDAVHSGRFVEAAVLVEAAREAGERAGDRNAELFAGMLSFQSSLLRGEFEEVDSEFLADKIANSPAGMAYRSSYAWILAGLGREEEGREQLAIVAADRFANLAFDANWISAVGECAEACAALGDAASAATLYDVLVPYAGRPLTAGRAIVSYGVADRHLGILAALLGRPDDAVAHLEAAIALDGAAGMRPWVVHARLALAQALEARGDRARAREVRAAAADEAAALGLTGLIGERP